MPCPKSTEGKTVCKEKNRKTQIKMDLRRMGIRSRAEKATNRDQWRLIVEEVKADPGL
jgi:hypothetical protein